MTKGPTKVGDSFGRWTIISKAETGPTTSQKKWRCRCACGVIRDIHQYRLRSGNSRSCGCLFRSLVADRSRTHNMSRTQEYRIWAHMLQRCLNQKSAHFSDYGGRGITVCEEWRTNFVAFFSHIGKRPSPRHSLDRIDNNGHYEPGNVKWSTQKEQCQNLRRNRIITHNGTTACLTEWSRITGIRPTTISGRINGGWSEGDAVSIPTGARA